MSSFMSMSLRKAGLCLLLGFSSGCSSSDSENSSVEIVKRNGGLVSPHGDIDLIVRNKSSAMICISPYSWPGFGHAQPTDGFIGFSGAKTIQWPWLDKTPAETIIVWSNELENRSDSNVKDNRGEQLSGSVKIEKTQFAQTIDLKRLAEHRVKNLILFELQENGAWKVFFDEEATEDWKEREARKKMMEKYMQKNR